jgi:hypothetical protein
MKRNLFAFSCLIFLSSSILLLAGSDSHIDSKHTLHKKTQIAVVQNNDNQQITKDNLQKHYEELNSKSFSEFTERLQKKLPLKASLANLGHHDVHTTPELIIESARELGRVKQKLKENSELVEDAIVFYEGCIAVEEVVTSVRALCLSNLLYLKLQKRENVELGNYPKKLVSLAIKNLRLPF